MMRRYVADTRPSFELAAAEDGGVLAGAAEIPAARARYRDVGLAAGSAEENLRGGFGVEGRGGFRGGGGGGGGGGGEKKPRAPRVRGALLPPPPPPYPPPPPFLYDRRSWSSTSFSPS